MEHEKHLTQQTISLNEKMIQELQKELPPEREIRQQAEAAPQIGEWLGKVNSWLGKIDNELFKRDIDEHQQHKQSKKKQRHDQKQGRGL